MGFDRLACGPVAGQAARTMEDGETGVRVFVDPDLGLDVVVAMPVGGELQAAPLVAPQSPQF